MAAIKAIFDIRRRSGRAKRALPVAGVPLLLAMVAAPPAGARVPSGFYGVVPYTPLTHRDFKRMGDARVGSLRQQFYWPAIQPTRRGPLNWGGIDATVAEAASQHIAILPTLAGTPPYEAGGCTSHGCGLHIRLRTKGQRRDWQAFVRAAVARYGPHGAFWAANSYLPYMPIRRWQIWNEQNNPVQHNSPRLYGRLVVSSGRVLHNADHEAKLVLGGMFGTPKGSKRNTAWNYLKRLYKTPARHQFNAVALHPYSPTTGGIRTQVKRVRRVLKRHHDSKREIFVTEIGWGSSRKRHAGTGSRGAAFNVGLKQQKRKLVQSFGLLTRHRRTWRVGGVYWFTWRDPRNAPAGLCAFCYSSGLLHASGKAKPALSAYKRFTRKTK